MSKKVKKKAKRTKICSVTAGKHELITRDGITFCIWCHQ